MGFDFSEVTGTYPGDPAGKYLEVNTSVSGTSLTLRGQWSDSALTTAAIVAFNQTLTFPAADPALVTYVSVQVTNLSGTLAIASSTAAPPALGGNLIEIYKTQIPAGATSDENNPGDTEPDF